MTAGVVASLVVDVSSQAVNLPGVNVTLTPGSSQYMEKRWISVFLKQIAGIGDYLPAERPLVLWINCCPCVRGCTGLERGGASDDKLHWAAFRWRNDTLRGTRAAGAVGSPCYRGGCWRGALLAGGRLFCHGSRGTFDPRDKRDTYSVQAFKTLGSVYKVIANENRQRQAAL